MGLGIGLPTSRQNPEGNVLQKPASFILILDKLSNYEQSSAFGILTDKQFPAFASESLPIPFHRL